MVVKRKTKKSQPEENALTGRVADEGDVDEGHKVFDMSSIPTPVIEFEMPNLVTKEPEPKPKVEKKEESVEGKKKKSKKEPKKTKEVKQSEEGGDGLTALKLNNHIVKMRGIVKSAKVKLVHRLVRKKKELLMKAEKMKDKKDELMKKALRLGEEIESSKSIDNQSVSKFALLNTKTLDQLHIVEKTPPAKRALYKLATEEIVVKSVKEFRAKYKDWEATTAYLLQRLGLQYSGMKTATEGLEEEEEEKEGNVDEKEEDGSSREAVEEEDEEEDDDNDDDEEDDDNGSSEDDHKEIEDVDIAESDEDGDASAEKRRKLILGLIGDPTATKAKPAPKKGKKTVSADVQAALNEQFGRELEKSKKTKKDQPSTTVVRKLKLSEGGVIEKTEVKKIAKVEKKSAVDEEGEEEEGFFLPVTKKGKVLKEVKPVPEPESEPEPKTRAQKKRKAPEMKSVPAAKKSEQVHPSWAARMKQKEQQTAAPCGKKTVFGDDD